MTKINFIAELCQNHLGNTKNVESMLEQCVANGAKTIKLQYIYANNLSFRPRFENGIKIGSKFFSIKRPYRPEFNRLKKLELPEKSFERFVKLCQKFRVDPMVTCFSREHVNKIYNHGFKHVKIASYDCCSFQMIRELSKKFKKIVVSTGATYDDEITNTVKILKKAKIDFVLLHCVTLYPTPFNYLNLSRIKYLNKFTKNVGYSDHTLSINNKKNLASLCAIYFGAKYIERHIRILKPDESKDGKVSIKPDEISELINFSNLKKKNQLKYLRKVYNVNPKDFYGKEKRDLTHEELLNRDYYKGRFISKSKNRIIYNWDEVAL